MNEFGDFCFLNMDALWLTFFLFFTILIIVAYDLVHDTSEFNLLTGKLVGVFKATVLKS